MRFERQTLLERLAALERALETSNERSRQLAGRVAEFERRPASGAAAPAEPDADWLSETAARTAQVLRSGQELADGIAQRARQRAEEIRQVTLEQAEEVRARAEADAEKIRKVAYFDAEGMLQNAQSSSDQLIAEARRQQQEITEQFAVRRAALQEEVARLDTGRLALLETLVGIRRSVDTAVRALEGERHRPPGAKGSHPVVAWWQGLKVAGPDERRPAPAGSRAAPAPRPAPARAEPERPRHGAANGNGTHSGPT